jgi:arylsulfatase A-like enzyme/Tfp pilus assembly protein PilF
MMSLLLVQCGSESQNSSTNAIGKNVLLISMDTTRVDYLEPYGGGKANTPNLQALAHDGIVFVDAVTPAPLTVPAHASLFTGLHPVRHSVQDNFKSILGGDALTIAELFTEAGYETAGVIGAILLSKRNGFHQGFQHYDDEFQAFEFQAVQPTVERKAATVSAKTVDWLDQFVSSQSQKPFFLFTHFYDPHMMYNPPEPFLSRYPQAPYAGEISYTDQQIGMIMDALKRHKLYEETLIIVVGDHGEGLKNHLEQTHGLFLYDEVIRVPFIIKAPKSMNLPDSLYVRQSASLLDVVPTLVELCGLGFSDNDGMSLVPWLSEETPVEERYTIHDTQYPLTYNWSPNAALRSQQWKYIHAPKPELYNLQTDPKELDNVIVSNPKQAATMRSMLEERLQKMVSLGSLSAVRQMSSSQSEVLTSLGYASGGEGSNADTANLPDPKDKIEVYELIDNGLGMMARNKINEAVQTFQEAIHLDPNNANPHFNLAMAYSRLSNWALAVETMKKAITMADDHIYMYVQLARIYAASGEYDQAEEILLRIVDERPSFADAHFQLGWINMQRKKYEDALQYFNKAKEWMPDMPGLDGVIQEAQKNVN